MKYTFNYSDGRNYRDQISDGFKVNAKKGRDDTVIVNVYSSQAKKITMILSRNEAVAIGHSLLASANSTLAISAENK